MMNKSKIGVIGNGYLANLVAGKLISSGHIVVVLNSNKIENDNIKRIVSNAPADIGNICTVIITIIEDSTYLENVLVGNQGLINSRKSDNVVIDMSPVSPEFIQEIAEKIHRNGTVFS